MVKLAQEHASEALQMENVAWATLEKVAKKQIKNNALPEGSQHAIKLKIEGDIDGHLFRQQISSLLSIGNPQTRSSSVNPQVPELIAWILSKLNRATRNRILVDLPDEFSASGNQIPKSSEILVSEVEHLLRKLRQTKTVSVRGAIRCEYTL